MLGGSGASADPKTGQSRVVPRGELGQSPLPLLLEGPVPRTAAGSERELLFVDPVSQFDPRDRDLRVSE